MPEVADLSFRRRELLAAMGDRELTARELAEALDREPTNVHRDLRWMWDAGYLTRHAEGQRLFYRVVS